MPFRKLIPAFTLTGNIPEHPGTSRNMKKFLKFLKNNNKK